VSVPARGLIYRFDFRDLLQGYWAGEPDGERFVVVVSPRWLNERVETVIVAPTTASQVDERSEMLSNVLLVPDQTATGITKPCVVQLHLLHAVNRGRRRRGVALVGGDKPLPYGRPPPLEAVGSPSS
jgi:mRNA-degrading endonuclease toxin of MazEF toxin-antitoxin module